jgi:hypothetical protein
MEAATPAVPTLPAADIRCALDAGDWDQAGQMLAQHQQAVAQALGQVDWSRCDRTPWIDLLTAQRSLLDDLRTARDEAAAALQRLNADHRGARAWLRELA